MATNKNLKQIVKVEDSPKVKSEMQKRLDDRVNTLLALHLKVLATAETEDEHTKISG